MKLKTLLKATITTLCISLVTLVQAQNYSFTDVAKGGLKNSGTIVEGNVIKGYFYFYFSEKISRKNNAYEIVILNENLEEKSTAKIVEPKTTYMMEAAYNEKNILFKFYDTKSKMVSYRTMDPAGNLSAKETREANKHEISGYVNSISTDQENTNVQAISEKLFIDVHNYKDKQYKYSIQGLTNSGEIDWTYTPTNKMKIEMGEYLGNSDDQIWIQVSQSKGIMSRDYTFDLAGISTTGEEDFRIPLQTSRYNLLAHNATYKKEEDEIVILGEYYDIKDKSMKSDSKGVFIKVINSDGSEVSEDFISWSRDIGGMLSPVEKKDLGKYYVYFHKIIQTADGKILAIGEQYRKQVSAGGLALQMLAASSGNVSTDAGSMEIKLGKMIVIEIGADYTLSAVDIHDKKETRVNLPQGYGMVSQHLLAKVLKAEGLFNYSFTQNNDDNSLVTFSYVDVEKVKGKMRKQAVAHFISYVQGEEEYTADKLLLTTEASSIWFMPAKPGYVLIIEFFKKEKTMELRLEPINY
ncbi:MAG: hypothetical protein ACI9JN_002255 [Bacteroidia bacterium]|jgi:hypothetical protein